MATSNVNTDWNAVISSAKSQIAQIDQQLAQLKAQAQAKQGDAFAAASAEYNALVAKRDAEIKAVRDQIPNIESQIVALRTQAASVTPTFEQITDARKASEADPNNAALKATYEQLKTQRNSALAPFNTKIAALEQQRLVLVTKQNQIEAAYAPQLKAIQAKQTAAQDLIKAEVNQAIQLDDKKSQLQDQINEAERQLAIQQQGTTTATTNTTSATTVPASGKPGNATTATTTTTTTASNNSTTTTVTNTTNSTANVGNATVTSNSTTVTTSTTSNSANANTTTANANSTVLGNLLDAPPLVDTANLNADIANLTANITANLPNITDPDAANPGEIFSAENRASAQDEAQFAAAKDWRVRLALAPGADYFYNASDPGIMSPLKDTNGVVFPYTPAIGVNYTAKYEPASIVHTNYVMHQYSSSAVEQVTITGDFTCQDVAEAQYLLATIHFFRSMTKMFYGQDKKPRNGTPPPLCYMYGMGGYQFAAHPLAITGFTYNLPNDVDYIKTTGSAAAPASPPVNKTGASSGNRLAGTGAVPGGAKPAPQFSTASNNATVTWVPTRIQLAITCLPIMSRNQVSNNFSLEKYASGNLLLGTQNKGGGFW